MTLLNLSFLQTGERKGLRLEKWFSQPLAASDFVQPKRPDDGLHCQTLQKLFKTILDVINFERDFTFDLNRKQTKPLF